MAVVKLTAENFEQEVLKSDKPVLVDFYADWCGPCKMMAPVIEQISNEETEIKVGKINIDENIEIAQKYKVMSIPMFIAFKNGNIKSIKNNLIKRKIINYFRNILVSLKTFIKSIINK